MPFTDLIGTIQSMHQCVRHYFAWICTKPHGTAFLRNTYLIRHRIDHMMAGRCIEFAGISTVKTCCVAGPFDHCDLEPKTDPKVGYPVFSCIFAGCDLSFDAAVTEAAGNDYSGGTAQQFLYIFRFNFFTVYPTYIDFCACFKTGMVKTLDNGKICVVQSDIFADDCNSGLPFPCSYLVDHILPLRQLRFRHIKAKLAADYPVQPVPVQHERRFVQAWNSQVFNDAIPLHVAEQRYFCFDAIVQRLVRPCNDDIR